MPFIETTIEGNVGTICLDYFEKRNALSAGLVEEMLSALDTFGERRTRRHLAGATGRKNLVGRA